MAAPTPRAEALAAAFLSADAWRIEALVLHGAAAFGVSRRESWLRRAAKHALEAFREAPRSRFRELALVIDSELAGVIGLPPLRTFPVPALAMGTMPWNVPALATAGDLAKWLEVTPAKLMWFADPRGLERRIATDNPLRHYRYTWIAKPSGGLRLLEVPKPRIKSIGKRILHSILDRVPAHEAAHGFQRGRSAVTHAANHSGMAIVVRVDLADFFLSIRATQVRAIFTTMGYPSEVAWLLTCLTTNIAPVTAQPIPPGSTSAVVQAIRRTEMLARTRHLPQGAPTSPALANLAAYGLDVRLSAAASAVSARYSRYADDLVFSGDASFARRAARFVRLVEGIARDEGFMANRAKTRLMRRGARQQVTGVVVNERPTIGRAEAERLEAILFNCVRYGPTTQNRQAVPDFRAHLRGLVAHAHGVDTRRSARLVDLLAQINWD